MIVFSDDHHYATNAVGTFLELLSVICVDWQEKLERHTSAFLWSAGALHRSLLSPQAFCHRWERSWV